MSNPVHPIVGPEDYLSPYSDIEYSKGPKIIYGDVDVFTVVLNDTISDADDEWGRTEQIALRMSTDELISIHKELFGYSGILGLKDKTQVLFDSFFVGLEGNNFTHPELTIFTVGDTRLSDGNLSISHHSFINVTSMVLNNGSFSLTIDPITVVTTISSFYGSNTPSLILDPSNTQIVLRITTDLGDNDYTFTPTSFSIPADAIFEINHGVIHFLQSDSIKCAGTITLGATSLIDGLLILGVAPEGGRINFDDHGNFINNLAFLLGSDGGEFNGFSAYITPSSARSILQARYMSSESVYVGFDLFPADPMAPPGPFVAIDVNDFRYIFYTHEFNLPVTTMINFGDTGDTNLQNGVLRFGATSPSPVILSYSGLQIGVLNLNETSLSMDAGGSINIGTSIFSDSLISLNSASDSGISLYSAGGAEIFFSASVEGVASGDVHSPIHWVSFLIPSPYALPWNPGTTYTYDLDVVNSKAPNPNAVISFIVTVWDITSNIDYPENGIRFSTNYSVNSGHYQLSLTIPVAPSDITSGNHVYFKVLIIYGH